LAACYLKGLHTGIIRMSQCCFSSGTWVADMRASDRDSGRNGDVAYSIAEQPSDHFVIDRASGSVVVRTELSQVRHKRRLHSAPITGWKTT